MADDEHDDDSIAEIVDSALAAAGPAPQPLSQADEQGDDAREEDRGRAHLDALIALANLLPNDTDNGRRLISWYGRDLTFVRDVGWHVWTGKVWEPIGGAEAVLRLAQRTARHIAVEAEVIFPSNVERRQIEAGEAARWVPKATRSESEEAAIVDAKTAMGAWMTRRGRRRAFSVTCGNGARIGQMITQAAPHLTTGVEQMDADPYLLNLENGTLVFERLRDPEAAATALFWRVRLKEHDSDDRLAKLAPARYEPDAECPRFCAFLDRFQPSRAVQNFLQVYYGYSLLGVIGAQKLVFHYGEGANGKSTFIEALARLFGPYARSLNAESLTGTQSRAGAQASPDLAQLPGARMVRISELPRGEPLREALVKSLTGGEPMMVRHNYGNFFEFRPAFKASMSGNDRPRIDGVDHGIWRRIALVVWGVTIADNERREMEDVLAEFAQERAGILNWLIRGALIYLEEGLIEPPEVKEATRAYRADMDQVQGFIDACVARLPPPQPPPQEPARIASRMLYEAYESWCLANAMKPWSERAFSMTMVKKGFVKHDGRIRTFEGLRLHDVPDRPEPRSPRRDEDR
jgi:putative DNA primase/helicase